MRKLSMVAVAATSIALAAGTTTAASAADTSTTFTLTGGALSISAPAAAALANAAVTAGTTTGAVGPVQVTDARGSIAGWTALAASTDFVGTNGTIAKSAINYAPGTATAFTGVAITAPGTGGAMTNPQTAYSASASTGNNSTTWNPTLTVTFGAQSIAQTYTATVTHSVS